MKKREREEKNFYIRFEHETTDYLVVLSVRKKGFLFVTAYPLFYINRKQICDKQYEHIKHTKPQCKQQLMLKKNNTGSRFANAGMSPSTTW